jgi:high-affinity nickel-transport protein
VPAVLPLRRRALAVVATALLLNGVAVGATLWLGGFGAAGLGIGAVAYLLGVRHAFDADHIAAIDNVTRRLRASGQRPAGVGLFFSLGHAIVVLLLTAAAVVAARRVQGLLPELTTWGSLIGNAVSAGFLTLIGLANLRVLAALLRRRGADGVDLAVPGLNRFARHADSSWKMLPLGFLFGLSFDTASEVALLALSVAAAHDVATPVWIVLLLPLLFTAGMALTDTLESLLMLRVYDWAAADRDRTLRLNTVITAISVFLALAVALDQWVGLYAGRNQVQSSPLFDSSTVGMLVTALMLGLGAMAWLWRRPVAAARG